MKKIEMSFKNNNDIVTFDSIQELMEYIVNYRLLGKSGPSDSLVKIWNHDSEKFAIDSKDINTIIIRDVYKAEVRHHQTFTFHNKESFDDFMVAMGATRGNIHTGARYGIYGGEIVTNKYDCYISGLTPDYEQEGY